MVKPLGGVLSFLDFRRRNRCSLRPSIRGGKRCSDLCVQEAIEQLHRRVTQFNACVPYAGVAAGVRPEEVLLPALFALLPLEQAVGITVSPPNTLVG